MIKKLILLLNKLKKINKQYRADFTKKPLRNIEKAVGDSTWTRSNQKWKGARGTFTPKPNNITINIIFDSSDEILHSCSIM